MVSDFEELPPQIRTIRMRYEQRGVDENGVAAGRERQSESTVGRAKWRVISTRWVTAGWAALELRICTTLSEEVPMPPLPKSTDDGEIVSRTAKAVPTMQLRLIQSEPPLPHVFNTVGSISLSLQKESLRSELRGQLGTCVG